MIEHRNIRFTQHLHFTLRILIVFFIIISILLPIPMIPSVHAEVSLDGSLGSSGTLVGPNYTIGHDLGRLQGANLFHSFGRFNVMTGESATFTGPNAIANVIGRITGGTVSSIDGLLRSTIQDANLFLINPSGIMFGPNATLDLNGSFHVSTADYLRLADGGIFYADPIRSSVLTVASPSAFGFLGDNPAGISIQESTLILPEGETFSLGGGDLRIVGGSISARGGGIKIASVSSSGEVTTDMDIDSFERLGNIDIIEGADIVTSGDGDAGDITLIAASVNIDESRIDSQTYGDGDAGDINLFAASVNIDGGMILSDTYGDGDAGNISLDVGNLIVKNGGHISSTTHPLYYGHLNRGNGGDVTVTASDSVFISSPSNNPIFGAGIDTTTFSRGNGGTIAISAPTLIIDNGRIRARVVSSSGRGGDIYLDVGSLTLMNGGQINTSNSAPVNASGPPYTESQGGNIYINAEESVSISGDRSTPYWTFVSEISSENWSLGKPGSVSISTPILTMDDRGLINAAAEWDGHAGSIAVAAENVTLTGGAQIITTSSDNGNGGNLQVIASDVITLSGTNKDGVYASGFLASTYGNGQGGEIDVQAGQINITDRAGIWAHSEGEADAGSINIAFQNTFILKEGYIDTKAIRTDGGNINIHSGSTLYLVDGKISAEVGGGSETTGGNIFIELDYVALNDSKIVANANEGKGGNIRIVAGTFLGDPYSVVSASSALGIDGTVDIEAPDVNVTGVQVPLPKVVFSAADFLLDPCIARLKAGETSSFIISGRDGLPIQPGQLLPSPVFIREVAEK